MLGQASYTRTEGAASQRNHVRFYMESVQDERASADAGRPIFFEREMAEIIMPGIANLTKPTERVTDFHRQEYAKEYDAFKAGRDVAVDGTPIDEWPILNRSMVLELKALEIRSVEDIANLSDLATQKVMGLMGLREKARAFLDDADRMALSERLSKENDDLRAEIAAQKHQIEELGQITRQLHSDFMATRNAPNALNTVIPGMIDPTQAGGYDSPGAHSEPAPQSSLAAFADSKRPGRRKAAEADA